MTGRETEKAQGYLKALDEARSEERWHQVPELIRKITKHAPHRKCLIQTASAEVQVVAHINNKRPSTAKGQSEPTQVSSLHDLIPELISAIDAAEGTPQDVFQARVCLGWIHWTLSEPSLAAARLPNSFDESTIDSLVTDTEDISKWTEVCIAKGSFIKTAAQSITSGPDDALNTAVPVLPRLAKPPQSLLSCPQALYWSEKLLSKTALMAGEKACSDGDESMTEIALRAFRLWSNHPQVKRRDLTSHAQAGSSLDAASQASTWMSYYQLLSIIVQEDMVYTPPGPGSPRNHLANELRKIESICENVLLRDVKFPRANASNPHVEEWVEQVIRNWEVLCGPRWRDEDLGEGGQDAVGRNVLDILYRAATKTYHSHLILRRLFHVHASLAEFDLAIKALDSYIDLVVSAKDRAEKAAGSGTLERDEILLQTVSEGVLLLCSIGSRKEAEKAKNLIEILEKFLEKDISRDLDGESLQNGDTEKADEVNRVSPKVVALAYRAIGIGLANWSRWTPVNEARDDIRAEAIENLERSLAPEFGEQYNLSTLYALALVLAESRDLDAAIDYVKLALSSKSYSSTEETESARLTRQRDLVPLWHLLALLLSAKEDFTVASRSCEAAFEQFPAVITGFGHSSKRKQRDSSQRGKQDPAEERRDFVSSLRGREKERILETLMTQLALMEVLEGPEAAVNNCDQLLTLFMTLFDSLQLDVTAESASKQQQTRPKSSAGTIKSIRGSIFGWKKGSRVPERVNGDVPPLSTQDSGNATNAPTMQVTGSTTVGTGSAGSRPQKLQKHEAGTQSRPPTGKEPKAGGESTDNVDQIGIAVSDTLPERPKSSARQSLPPVAHNVKHTSQPPPVGHKKQPPEQDVRLPPPHRFESPTRALTLFSAAHTQKHALTVLVKIWLLIAGLYRRAALFEDAREACEEAAKHAGMFENLVAAQESSARAFSERPLGISKSSEELWADVFAERGSLSQAQNLPYEAMSHYEDALTRDPNNPKATVGLANLLLDIWEEKIPPEPPQPRLEANVSSTLSFFKEAPAQQRNARSPALNNGAPNTTTTNKEGQTDQEPSSHQRDPGSGPDPDPDPRYLGRLAARDRAFGLLSALTKQGSSWDNSEAWYALSRAYEAGSQVEKTKEVLWWCVELEDRKPIRHWSNVGSGSYVL